MVGTKLSQKLKQEADYYLNLPYMINILRDGKIIKERFMGGKGNWKDIQKETKRLTKAENIDINKLNPKKLYNFQKKHKIGIDCSGLVIQLLTFYGNLIGKKVNLNPRKTSADMLTSLPLSQKITDYDLIQPGDLIRQKNGHHILFILDKKGKIIDYIDSSFEGRGVKYGQVNIYDPLFDNQGIFRLNQFTK
jgi:hypothetical protein